jgi:hypothetical protein
LSEIQNKYKHESIYTKFKAKHNAGKNTFVKYNAKIGHDRKSCRTELSLYRSCAYQDNGKPEPTLSPAKVQCTRILVSTIINTVCELEYRQLIEKSTKMIILTSMGTVITHKDNKYLIL